jgi:ribosomal protein S27AE
MKGLEHEKICPQCGALKMKDWHDLTDDQKFLIERLPLNTDFSPEQRKKHRFCERCFYEEVQKETIT